MNLTEYIKTERGNATKVAAALEVSLSYFSQMAVPGAYISPIRCVAIETVTGKAVTRQELRPDDWHLIWPELADKAAA